MTTGRTIRYDETEQQREQEQDQDQDEHIEQPKDNQNRQIIG